MTAPARQGASSTPPVSAGAPGTALGATAVPAPAPHPTLPAVGLDASDPAIVAAARRRRRLEWAAVIAVLAIATGITVAILLLQWLGTSSGTVGR